MKKRLKKWRSARWFCHPHKCFHTAILDFLYIMNILTLIFHLKYSFCVMRVILAGQTWLSPRYLKSDSVCVYSLCVYICTCALSILIILITVILRSRDKNIALFFTSSHYVLNLKKNLFKLPMWLIYVMVFFSLLLWFTGVSSHFSSFFKTLELVICSKIGKTGCIDWLLSTKKNSHRIGKSNKRLSKWCWNPKELSQ